MGGKVRVVVRHTNSHVDSFVTWTNSIAPVLKDIRFLQGESSLITESLEYFYEQRRNFLKEQEENTSVSKFSREYGSYSEQQKDPVEYGIIVVDFLNNEIYSMQDYTRLNERFINYSVKELNAIKCYQDNLPELEQLYRAGFIKKIEFREYDKIFDLTGETLEQSLIALNLFVIEKSIESGLFIDSGYFVSANFPLDTPFSYYSYELNESRQLLNDLRAAGFSFTPEDLSDWEAFACRIDESQDDEDE